MTKTYRFLIGVNVVGALAYLVIVGILTALGRPPFSGQGMLLGQVAFGLVASLVPALIERLGHFEFPVVLLVLFEAFILGSVLLGTGLQFYSIPYWDKFLHLFSASMLAGLGLAIFGALTPTDQLAKTSPGLLALFALSFGSLIGVCWEFYEFTGDGLFGLNMQRTMSGGHPLLGRAALMDTMGDLFADVFGALLLALWAYFGIKRNRAWLNTFMFHRQGASR